MLNTTCRDVYRGERLALQVLDRDLVTTAVHAEPYAIISITDPQFRHPRIPERENCKGILSLKFSDIWGAATRIRMVSAHVVPFTEEMAAQIVTFVAEHQADGVGLFVVHCDAGMSRSAGVAAALSAHYNGDENFFSLPAQSLCTPSGGGSVEEDGRVGLYGTDSLPMRDGSMEEAP